MRAMGSASSNYRAPGAASASGWGARPDRREIAMWVLALILLAPVFRGWRQRGRRYTPQGQYPTAWPAADSSDVGRRTGEVVTAPSPPTDPSGI
jgi:hypothetical protein